MTVRNNYEVFVENPVMRQFTQDRQTHAADSPTATQPFALLGPLAAAQVTGTLITLDSTDTKFIGDVGPGQVYLHNVRNVRTYTGGNAEATWAAIDEGDQIYYDLDTANTMPTDVRLSTSPLAADGTANPRFGWAVLISEDDVFPKGDNTASTQSVGVMQSGAGGIV